MSNNINYYSKTSRMWIPFFYLGRTWQRIYNTAQKINYQNEWCMHLVCHFIIQKKFKIHYKWFYEQKTRKNLIFCGKTYIFPIIYILNLTTYESPEWSMTVFRFFSRSVLWNLKRKFLCLHWNSYERCFFNPWDSYLVTLSFWIF